MSSSWPKRSATAILGRAGAANVVAAAFWLALLRARLPGARHAREPNRADHDGIRHDQLDLHLAPKARAASCPTLHSADMVVEELLESVACRAGRRLPDALAPALKAGTPVRTIRPLRAGAAVRGPGGGTFLKLVARLARQRYQLLLVRVVRIEAVDGLDIVPAEPRRYVAGFGRIEPDPSSTWRRTRRTLEQFALEQMHATQSMATARP
ncbi:hypothetical protein ACTMU2_35080 [Cupriavidus basilensis]